MGLEIDGSHEEQFAIVKTAVKAHDASLYGNGQPGLMDFMSSTKGQFRLLVVMLTAILVILGVLTFLEGNREFHSGLLSSSSYQYAKFERSTK